MAGADTASGANVAAITPILKEVYLGPIRDQINNKTILLHRLAKNEENISGKYAVLPLRIGGTAAIGATSDGGLLVDPSAQAYTTARIEIVRNYARILITGQSIAASRNDIGAFTRNLHAEIQNTVLDFKRDLNRQLFGDGSGRLCIVNSATALVTGADGTLDVKQPFGFVPNYSFAKGTKFLTGRPLGIATANPRGMFVAILNSAGALQTTCEIKQVNESAGANGQIVVRVASNYTTVVGDLLVRCSQNTGSTAVVTDTGFAQEMMGLGGIIDSIDPVGKTTNGLQNILVANVALWKANVFANGGVVRNLDLDLMQNAQFEADKKGDGRITLLITTYEIFRKYLALLQAQKRFVNTYELDGGWEALDFNRLPVIYDKDAPPGHMWMVDENALAIYRMSDIAWIDVDGSVLRRLTDKDAYQATLFLYAELGVSARNRHSVIRDLDEN